MLLSSACMLSLFIDLYNRTEIFVVQTVVHTEIFECM